MLYEVITDIAFSGIVDATGGTVTSGDSFGVYGGSSISVTASTTIAGGDSQAMSLAPDLTGYTGVSVLTGASADGSNTNTWDNTTGLDTYQYLKIGQMYALTVDLYGGSGTTASSSYMAGDVVSISAGTKSGYTFSGWTATGGGTFTRITSYNVCYTKLLRVEDELNIPFYFCSPHSSWQKGSVENLNSLVREFFPRGTDFRDISKEEVADAMSILNNRPRKCLGWATPAEVLANSTF